MGKPNSPRETLEPQKKSKFDSMFLDCCAFVCVGLGVENDIAPCASIALIDSDDGGDSLSDGSSTRADTSTLFHDHRTYDTSYYEKDESDDTKMGSSFFTVSTLSMEKMAQAKKGLPIEDEDEERPSKLLLLSRNMVTGEKLYPDDEEESRTFNTLSTGKLPSSLDTKTAEIPASLDKTLEGLKLVDTVIEEAAQENTERNARNSASSRQLNPFDIERVPSLVDASGKDEQTVVSSMSVDDDALIGKNDGTGAKGPISKRLFKGKGKILRPWSWKNKKAANDCDADPVLPELRKPFGTLPVANGQHVQTEQSRPSASLTKPSFPIAVRSPQILPKLPGDSFTSRVPVIQQTKSNDVTATTIDTNEDDNGDNVPFDEPQGASPRFVAIEKVRVGRYLRPSSNVQVGEI